MSALTKPGEWTFGIQLPIQTLTRTLVDEWEDAATVDDLVAITKAADQHGYDFVGVCDHVAIPDNDYASKMTTTWYDTISTLSYLAAHTQHTHLLSVVWIAAYRHPLQTAKAFGTLDHLSGGRAILGVGAGHVEAEFDALGVDFRTRGKRLDETLEAVRGAFADTYVSHEGDFFSYADVGVSPQPQSDTAPRTRITQARRASRKDNLGNPFRETPRTDPVRNTVIVLLCTPIKDRDARRSGSRARTRGARRAGGSDRPGRRRRRRSRRCGPRRTTTSCA